MTQENVKNALNSILNRIYYKCHEGFNKAKRDRFWEVAKNRYRSERIWTVTTHLLEEEFKSIPEITTDRDCGSFRFELKGVVGRYKKLNGRKKLPQNIQTYRNNQFVIGQLSFLDSTLYNKTDIPSPIPVTIGYWTDKFYEKIYSIEVICQALNFRFNIEEPQEVIKLTDNMQPTKRETKVIVSEKAKKERKQYARRKKNGQSESQSN